MDKELKEYQKWLHYTHLEQNLKHELEHIQGNDLEIVDRFYTSLAFGTGGLRGVLGAGTNRMNVYTVRKVTLGLAHYLQKQYAVQTDNMSNVMMNERIKVAISYDNRHQSKEFAEQAALTLAQEGIQAYVYSSLRPTPQLSYTVRKLKAHAGIMITASHNPPEYNGYKVYGPDGAQINLKTADAIFKAMNQIENELSIPLMDKQKALDHQLIQYIDAEYDQAYAAYVRSLMLQPQLLQEMNGRLNILFTPFHGTALKSIKDVFHLAGYTSYSIVKEQAHPDPTFCNVSTPNPEEHRAFELAIEYAKKEEGDLIIGTDPDADRVGVVVRNRDGEYQVLTGNQTGALLLDYIVTQRKKQDRLLANHTLCKTIVTSEMGRAIAEEHGLQTINTLTGFKFIGEQIKRFEENGERKFLFGYEESYGYLIGEQVRDKDAIQAVLLLTEMAAYYKKEFDMSLYEALIALYERYGYYQEELISVTLKGKEGAEKIKHLLQQLREKPLTEMGGFPVICVEDYEQGKRMNLQTSTEDVLHLPKSNVIKYILEEESWSCIRPSGTEPKLKIYLAVKGESREEGERKMERLKQGVQKKLFPSISTV